MKRFWKIAGIGALILVLGAIGVAAVSAQSDEESNPFFDFRQRMHEAIAGILGIEADEYDAAVNSAREQVLQQAVDEGILSQEQVDRMEERMLQGVGPGMMRGGAWGYHGGAHGMMGGPENSLVAVAAGELGMTVDELVAELQSGQSIAGVAEARGVDPEVIADAFLAERTAWLAQAVADGRITQEQADAMLDHMADQVQEHLTTPSPGGPGEGGCWNGTPGTFRRGGGPGPMWGFPRQNEG